jgi:hypothetical protein
MKKKPLNSWEQPCADEFFGQKREPVHVWLPPFMKLPYQSCLYCEASKPLTAKDILTHKDPEK